MNDHPDFPKSGFVSVSFVRKRYAISNSTLYKWLAEDRLGCKPVRIGPRAVRFRVEDLRAFEAKLTARDPEPS